VPSHWAPYPSAGKNETVVDVFYRHFSKYSGGFIPADFNGDGKLDFIVIAPAGCEAHDPNARLDYGSSGGPAADFVISTPSGYSAAEGFRSFIDTSMIKRHGTKDMLEINGSGWNGSCGYVETAVWGWTGKQVQLIELHNDKGQVVDREGCAIPSGAATTATASSSPRIPLATGYYAYVEGTFSTCAKPVMSPWYFDGTRFWEEWDVTDPKHEYSSEAVKWEMVAANRFRITYRNRDEDGQWDRHLSVNEYVITGPQSFTYVGTVGGPLNANERHQLCTPSQLPAKAKWYKQR